MRRPRMLAMPCTNVAGGAVNARPEQEQPGSQALRNSTRMLRHLGDQLAWHRRTRLVNDELDRQLRSLDSFAWHIERDVSIGSVPIPLLVFGPSGVFLLEGTRGFWTEEDIALMSAAAKSLGGVLRDYPDPVRAAIVVLDDRREERQHFSGSGDGPCCVLGDGRLVPWLHRYRDHGFSEADIAYLREHSDPTRIREQDRVFTPLGEG
jgi:hypothetical protein